MQNHNTIALQQVEEELKHFAGLARFDQSVEDAYEAYIAPDRARQVFGIGLAMLCLMNLFLINDYFVRPELFGFAVAMRLGLVTVPGLVMLWLVRYGISARWREINAWTCFTLVHIAVALIFWQTRSAFANYDGYVMALTMLASNIVVPLYFRTCVWISITGVAVMSMAIAFHPTVTLEAKAAALVSYVLTTIFTLLTNYRLEVANRRNFLVTLRDQLRVNLTQELNRLLAHASNTDVLTQLPNRRHFEEVFAQCSRMGDTAAKTMAVLMIDVDHFKQYNDTWGHPQGDVCLRQVAQVIQSQIRAGGDVAARMGGEEFAVLLLDADLQEAWKTAERIRWAVAQASIVAQASEQTHRVTVSIGLALGHGAQPDLISNMLVRADTALYQAKRAGRNNVQVDHVSLQLVREHAAA
ncbi:GGDEF domain-containing protein [Curvibacter sp. CHRR-16]|uniref:GGDEF domain-containing protein n=1 Tax=Curvibacter sp. CHRR-16 TaxID=2835872 RepID=UPI001BD9BBA6|nr:GGDEF domain-containing protein [Curvibacter sp. CHRR-16]MBT0569035.1 GGDEF domain-containing protein [Curvibacter sp. CHRR-16]